jgi:acetyl-CoA carboxylase biotin carboxyl carrier protein
MDLRQLKSIIKEFEESTVHKLEITEKDFTVKLEKKGDPSIPVSSKYIQPESSVELNDASAVIDQNDNNCIFVKAPLVGTYFGSPSPDSDPFTILNQKVNKGDILFIIEAMKVMNEITAPVSGIVKRIHANNATMV